jgi:hypothetical protein
MTSPLLTTIAQLAELNRDWDDAGGLPLSENIRKLGEMVLLRLVEITNDQLAIGLIPDGGLDFGFGDCSIAIHPDWFQVWKVIPGRTITNILVSVLIILMIPQIDVFPKCGWE